MITLNNYSNDVCIMDFGIEINIESWKLYKDNYHIIINSLTKTIDIFGNIKSVALMFAIFINGTLNNLDEYDLAFEAFILSTAGKIITCRWQVKNQEIVDDFINEYNKIYDTVELLK